MTEDEMVGRHHRLSGKEFEQTPGDSEGQGGLACCSPWGHRQLDMTKRLNSDTLFLLRVAFHSGQPWEGKNNGDCLQLKRELYY